MDLAEIRMRVKAESDARFGETIEKMLLILRYRHTHQCWRKECSCDYCRFINGQYVNTKLALHHTKKRIRFYEQVFYLTENETYDMIGVESRAAVQKMRINELKEHKKELQKEIL